MSNWRDVPDVEEPTAVIEANSGPMFIRTFYPSGLHVAIEAVGRRTVFHLEPADALALADAIKREYGGRDE